MDRGRRRTRSYIRIRGSEDRQSNGERLSYIRGIRTRTTGDGDRQLRHQSHDGSRSTATISTTAARMINVIKEIYIGKKL